jgi:hypothetical protein
MSGSSGKAAEDRLTKANELARKAMQFAATGVNIREPIKRFIIELEARKDIPPKMLYGVFSLVAPWDQQARSALACVPSGGFKPQSDQSACQGATVAVQMRDKSPAPRAMCPASRLPLRPLGSVHLARLVT